MQCASSTTSSPQVAASRGSTSSRKPGLFSRSGLTRSTSTSPAAIDVLDRLPLLDVGGVDGDRADAGALGGRDLVAHQGQQRGDDHGRPGALGAQQQRGHEVDRRLAPAGPLHHQAPAGGRPPAPRSRSTGRRAGGRRRGPPGHAGAPRPARGCRCGHPDCLPAGPDTGVSGPQGDLPHITRSTADPGFWKVKPFRGVVSFTVLGDDRNGKDLLKSFAQSRPNLGSPHATSFSAHLAHDHRPRPRPPRPLDRSRPCAPRQRRLQP